MEECIFCKFVNKEISPNIVEENEHALAFLDINPVNEGHTLVIPKTHEDKLYDLSAEYYEAVTEMGRVMARRIEDTFNPMRVGMMVHGFDVPHAHLHVIPMHHGGDIQVGQKSSVNEEALKETAKKLRNTSN